MSETFIRVTHVSVVNQLERCASVEKLVQEESSLCII